MVMSLWPAFVAHSVENTTSQYCLIGPCPVSVGDEDCTQSKLHFLLESFFPGRRKIVDLTGHRKLWTSSAVIHEICTSKNIRSLLYDMCAYRTAPSKTKILHTHPFNGIFPGLPSGISWTICKPAPRSRQITTPAPHYSVFYRPDALPAAHPTASKHGRLKLKY